MIKQLYAIRDLKGGYLAPFVAENDAIAVRQAKIAVNDDRTELSLIYDDCDLYAVGVYDTDSGQIQANLKFIVSLKDLKDKKEVKADV